MSHLRNMYSWGGITAYPPIVIQVCISEMLKTRGRTRYWLAKQTGITYPAIDNLCKGKTQRIDFTTLGALCDALDCQPSDLLVNISEKGTKEKAK